MFYADSGMRREQLPEHVRPNYVVPRYKTAYIAVSKAACTSLKWLIADIQGEDPEQFVAVSRMVTRDLEIHVRSRWNNTPTLHQLSDQELAEIDPENGWFIFTVVRHPAGRAFSAWQSKLLLRDPRWVLKHGHDQWFPRVPRTSADVLEDFRRWVLAMAENPGQKLMRDRHFMPQWRLAAPDRMRYSRIYGTHEIPHLVGDLERHLRAHGYEGELRLRDSNETPLKPLRAAFTPDVVAALRKLYADDYDGLGYEHDLPERLSDAEGYPDSALVEISRLIERHERIGDLAALAIKLEKRLALVNAAQAAKPNAGLAARLRRRLSTRRAAHRAA